LLDPLLQAVLVILGESLLVHEAGHAIQLDATREEGQVTEVQTVRLDLILIHLVNLRIVLQPQRLRWPLVTASHAVGAGGMHAWMVEWACLVAGGGGGGGGRACGAGTATGTGLLCQSTRRCCIVNTQRFRLKG
jgi:hypothetical protein